MTKSPLGYAKNSRIIATVPCGDIEANVGGKVLAIARMAGWVKCRLDDMTTRKLGLDKVEAEQ
jgi:hypothetical protein